MRRPERRGCGFAAAGKKRERTLAEAGRAVAAHSRWFIARRENRHMIRTTPALWNFSEGPVLLENGTAQARAVSLPRSRATMDASMGR